MIEGAVNSHYEAVVPLSLQGPGGRLQEVEAVVDTGYNGYLTLPPSLIARLELRHRSHGQANLADGSVAYFDYYGVTVLWDGSLRDVDAGEMDSRPLVGMRLMDGHDLIIRVRIGGRVVIQATA